VTGEGSLELAYVKPELGVSEPELLTVPLNHDHIKSYQTDPSSPGHGFLMLISEVQIQFLGPRPGKAAVTVEPIHGHPKVGTRRPGPAPIYRLASARVTHTAQAELRGTARISAKGTVVQKRPPSLLADPGYTFAGVRELIRELDYMRLKRLADDHVPHVFVTLQWQAPADPERKEQLRHAIGTIFGLEELAGAPVQRLHGDDIERYFRGTVTVMRDSKFLLWLDHGHATRVVDRPVSGIERIESDHNYHLQFRVRPEGCPVGREWTQ
jgi:hypothetical protein